MAVGALGQLVISLAGDVVKFISAMDQAEVRAAAATKAIAGKFEELNRSIENRFVAIGAAIGAGLSVTAFAGQIKAVAEFRAKLDDLADSGLGAVEALSKIQQAVKLSGGNFDQVAEGLQKMVKGLAGSEKETSQAGEALRRLGVSARDTAGNLRDPADVMQDVAKRFAQYKDGADKAAFAQAIFGRGGASLLPVLKDMVEFGDLQAKVTTRQAAEAENFNRALTRMQIALEGSSKKIAGEMIPAATALFQTIEQLAKSSNGTKGAIDEMAKSGQLQDWAAEGVKAIAFVVNAVDGLYRMVKLAGEFWGFAAAQAVEFGRAALGALQLAMGPTYWKDGLANIAKAATGLARNKEEFKGIAASILEAELAGDKLLKKFQENYRVVKLLGQAMAGEFADQVSRRFGTATKPTLDSDGLGATATAQLSEYEKALNHLTERQAVLTAELANGNEKLTETEKFLAKLAENAELSWEEYDKLVDALGRTTVAMEKELALRDRVKKAHEEAVKALEDEQKALDEANGKANQSYNDMIRGIADQAEAINKEAASYGLLDSQKQRNLITDLETQLNLEKEGLARSDIINKLQGEIFARQRLMAAMSSKEGLDAAVKSMQEQQRAFDDFTKSVTDVGADAFVRLWDGGRDGFKSLLDDLWKWFKQFVARMLAEKIIVPVVMSAVGIPGTASANALGLSNLFTGGSAVSGMDLGMGSLLSSAGAFATNFAGSVATFSNVTGNFAFAVQSLQAGNVASALGALGPYAAAIAAVSMIYEAFKDKGENWKARLGYGANANAYATDTTFGRVGFTNIAGSDELNRQIQKFFDSFKGFDERILKTLKDGQETAIRAAVANLTSTREFAFPKGDATAGQQLTQQVLQEYYGAIFGALGADYERFTAAIKNWTGSVEDLLKTIDAMVGALELVSSGTIKGLTIPILEEWQREGESLAQTMQRIVTNFATFVDKFAPEQFKLDLMVKPFTDAMKDLNVQLPASRAGFFAYVQALDLTDEKQRAIYDEIMNHWLPAADAYYTAIDKQVQAQQAAADTVNQALQSLMTPSERLAAAQQLLASHNITSRESLIEYIKTLDGSTEAGRNAIQMLGELLKAFDLVANANPDLHGLDRFRDTTHRVVGEASAAADAVDQASDALANLSDAAQTFQAYVDTAVSQQQSLLSRYGSSSTIEDMQRAVDGIRAQFEAVGIAAPTTTSAIAAMAQGLDATTPRGIVLLRMLTELADAMDTLQQATDRAAQGLPDGTGGGAGDDIQQQAIDRANAIHALFESLKTGSERLTEAQQLIAGTGITSLAGLRAKLQELADQGATVQSLQALADAFGLVTDAAAQAAQAQAAAAEAQAAAALSAAQQIDAALASLITPDQQRAADLQLLSTLGISNLDGLTAYIRSIDESTAAGQSAAAGLQALIAAFQRVHDAAVRQADDQHASIAAGAAERAKYVADVQAIWSSLTSGAERLAAATVLLTSRGLGASTTATQLQDWITQMGRAGMSITDIQAIVDAWHQVTEAAQEAADKAAQAMVDAASKLADEIERALANVARAAEFRQGISDTIARLTAGRPGSNYSAYLTGNVTSARTLFAGAQGFDAQLNAAGRLQTALQTRYEYEMQALTAARDAQIQAQQQAQQAAQQLGQAFKGLGDYAKSLLTGDLSPLSAEDKLAAAAQQYRDLLAKAQSGDSSAASSLQGAAQSYLQLAGDYFARNNPAYIAAFNDVQGNLAALGTRGDAQLQYAASAASSLAALANTLTPEMIALQDQYAADLGDLSDAVGDAQELQQQAAEDAALAYAEIAEHSAKVAENTANLPQDVRELIAAVIATGANTLAELQRITGHTEASATAGRSIAANSEAAAYLSGPAVGAPTL